MNTISIDKLPTPVMSYILSFIPEDEKLKALRTVSKFFKKCIDYNFDIQLANIEKNNRENPEFEKIIGNIRKDNPESGGFVWFQKFSEFNNINDNHFLDRFIKFYRNHLEDNKHIIDIYKLNTIKGISNLDVVCEKRGEDEIVNIISTSNNVNEVIVNRVLVGHKLKLAINLPPQLLFALRNLYSFPTQVINLYAKLGTVKLQNQSVKGLCDLDLQSNNIFYIPKEIGLLQDQLININLSFNNLSSIPKEIGNLFKLKKFFIAGNKIRFLPETMENLAGLEKLNVHQNPLDESSKTVMTMKAKLGKNMLLPSEMELPEPQDDNK